MGSLHLLLNFNHGHIRSEGKKQSSQKIRKKKKLLLIFHNDVANVSFSNSSTKKLARGLGT